MQWIKACTNEKGSTLIMAIVVLAAISVLGVTMITLSTTERDMATSDKVKQIAKYNCDICTVSINKLIRYVVDQSDQGILGVGTGLGSWAPGIEYEVASTGASDAEEFARKVLFGLDTDACEDVWLSPIAIADAVNAASGGDLTIFNDANAVVPELDSAADIMRMTVGSAPGTASQEHAAGYGHGLGEGGASGGGMELRFLIACRGRAPYSALHVNYSVYRKILGDEKDDR